MKEHLGSTHIFEPLNTRRLGGGVMGLVLALALLFSLCAGAESMDTSAMNADGHFKGAIDLPNGELAIAVTLEEGDDGWSGTIDIPAQGLKGLALAKVAVEGSKVHFEMGGVPGQPTFDGKLSESGDRIAGTFEQGGGKLSFAMSR